MGIANWLLETPPRLCQLRLYKSTEGMMACWATVAEMIVQWKNNHSYFARPTFEDVIPRGNDGIDAKINYLKFIEDWLSRWGFETQNEGWYGTWSPETLATLVKDKGPLLCIGDFGAGQNPLAIGGAAHAICVYGYTQQFGGVHYIDPWDADTKQMSLTQFRDKLWQSKYSVYSRRPNHRR